MTYSMMITTKWMVMKMIYSKLIDLSGLHKSGETNINDTATVGVNRSESSDEKLDMIIQMIKNLNERASSDDSAYTTTLNDDQVNFVVTYMLKMHDKYFKEFGLSQNVTPEFIWNIPKEICELSQKLDDYGYSDRINPLFWLYMFCIDIDEYSYAKTLKTMIDEFDQKSYTELSEITDAYEEANENEK